MYICLKGALNLMVIVMGKGIGDPSSNPKQAYLCVTDVMVKNLNPIMKTVMTYLIVAIKELIFVWCMKL